MSLAIFLSMITAVSDQAAPYSQSVPGTTHAIEMIPLPEAEGKPHRWVSSKEITWDLYDALVYRLDVPKGGDPDDGGVTRPTKPYLMADRGWGHAGYPALSVSHRGAEAWCAWMTAKTGRTWRLPSVQEWTALCASSGITRANAEAHGWIKGNAKRKTHPAGAKPVDAAGVHDLAGNVAEWCTTDDGGWVLMGSCYADEAGVDPCATRRTPVPEWNDTDPQIPKSIWWLSDAPFAGFRVICEGATTAPADDGEGSGTARKEKADGDTAH